MKWQDRHKLIPAVYVLFRKDNQILLTKRANTGYRDGFYSLPAGHLDGGEPAIMAAVREVKEEVGIDIEPQNLRLIHTQHRVSEEGNHERINLYFETEKWHGTPINAEPQKCSEICWVNVDALPDNLVPELKYLFKELAEDASYGHFGFTKTL
jgi:8-oxo-dGTP diphosphatase